MVEGVTRASRLLACWSCRGLCRRSVRGGRGVRSPQMRGSRQSRLRR
ncbi:hypothetical protein ACFPRL_34290 [Pseudoclavibacter helvolus]